MITIGIDPGLTGALALLKDGHCMEVHDMPTNPRDLWELVKGFPVESLFEKPQVYIEQAQAMPKQGVSSTFKTGVGYGVLLGILAAVGLPYETVTPAVWKRRAGLIGKDKEASRALARQLWPEAPLSRVKDHGRAEALLIARFGSQDAR